MLKGGVGISVLRNQDRGQQFGSRLLAIHVLLSLQKKGTFLNIAFFEVVVSRITKRDTLFRIVVCGQEGFVRRISAKRTRMCGVSGNVSTLVDRDCRARIHLGPHRVRRTRRLSATARETHPSDTSDKHEKKVASQHSHLLPSCFGKRRTEI